MPPVFRKRNWLVNLQINMTREEVDEFFHSKEGFVVAVAVGETDRYEDFKEIKVEVLLTKDGDFVIIEKDGNFTIFKEI